MCGITAIVNKGKLQSHQLKKANDIVAHRGPDDEGFLLWSPGQGMEVFSGDDTASATLDFFGFKPLPGDRSDWTVGLGHRRLSIIDLSPHGHQPMKFEAAGLAISFNGEIYNYIEIRSELEMLGHVFNTGSDTEVILHAWTQWGPDALHRFNGMFAFFLLDTRNQKLFAVRDRFGVKPLYYKNTDQYLAFGSEVKQLRTLPDYRFELNESIAYDYLSEGFVDHCDETFEVGLHQLSPGCYFEINVSSGDFKIHQWYKFNPSLWKGSEQQACDRFRELLHDSVRLRLRSDVPVGSALSGGLDSSTIVCLMRKVLEQQDVGDHLIKTITSCQEDKRYDESEFAQTIIDKVNAKAYKVFPSFEKLKDDLDKMLWHLDYPFTSTSQFSQWCVFEEAKRQGLTVMIDGQGADEQLAGYGGNDVALYAGLLGSWSIAKLWTEASRYKEKSGSWPTGFLLGAFQANFPGMSAVLPQRLRPIFPNLPTWLKARDNYGKTFVPKSLRQNLLRQVGFSPLPSLLRYEDRNSMAFSVESRVPFMDYRLIEFTLGLPENLIYRNGERKHILRRSFRGVVPDKILDRKDKMGFVSPEERWLKEEGAGWFREEAMLAVDNVGRFFENGKVLEYIKAMQKGEVSFNFEPWRIVALGRWINLQNRNV